MAFRRVLSLGQCGADHGSISRFLRTHFQAEVVPAHTFDEALQLLQTENFDLVLVNRILDATGEQGIDFIRQARHRHPTPPMMLVSNYPDAQQQAQEAGALPGFGKSSLLHPATVAHLRPYFVENVEREV